MINNKRTLEVLEEAIEVLDLVRIGRLPEPEEIRSALKNMREVRVEHLKEVG